VRVRGHEDVGAACFFDDGRHFGFAIKLLARV
jgi:hypothetical protein